VQRIGVVTVIHDIGRGFGGAEVLAFEIARRLDRDRFRSFVCITHAPPPHRAEHVRATIEELREAGVEVLPLNRQAWHDVTPWWRLFELIRTEKIDVVHAHLLRANLPSAVLARLARASVMIAHDHSWSFEGRRFRRFLDRRVIAPLTTRFLSVSEHDHTRLLEVVRLPASKVVTLEMGMPDMSSPAGTDVRAELGVQADAPLVGAMGRLSQPKGFEVLIEAAKLLVEHVPDARVAIFGDGPERDALRGLIDRYGLQGVVMLGGHRSDVADVLAALDVAVLPSHNEGRPVALMEYMAAERPIVASRVGGVPELVDDGVEALLVEPGSAGALAAAVRRMLEDRGLALRLAAAAGSRQRSQLSMDVMMRRLEGLYLAELAEADPAAAP